MLSWPLSDESDSELELDELELLELLESELESEAWPDPFFTSILSAISARSGISFCAKNQQSVLNFRPAATAWLRCCCSLVLVTYSESNQPLFAELWSATHCLVPDNGKVCLRAEVVSHGDRRIQIENHVPITPRNEYCFACIYRPHKLGWRIYEN